MLAESKAVNRSGYCSPKHKTKGFIEKYFKDGNKRIFITSFWQNAYRINEVTKLCRIHHKKLYPYDEGWIPNLFLSDRRSEVSTSISGAVAGEGT